MGVIISCIYLTGAIILSGLYLALPVGDGPTWVLAATGGLFYFFSWGALLADKWISA